MRPVSPGIHRARSHALAAACADVQIFSIRGSYEHRRGGLPPWAAAAMRLGRPVVAAAARMANSVMYARQKPLIAKLRPLQARIPGGMEDDADPAEPDVAVRLPFEHLVMLPSKAAGLQAA